ncbi:hypothetical protein Mtc_1692 [Methanocella conradii HZ254]|uniref:Uncharacterized protein n=1 Tax=Methanocella conradii (strain DSM 24694 / JCM 17849 / CGMCC 1.5162 / HZ254) TaxID=1041930 RepID=H8I8W7_METCZ|nr:hypothetical protein Mtc_1692 [Methanocella conradii HZ254]
MKRVTFNLNDDWAKRGLSLTICSTILCILIASTTTPIVNAKYNFDGFPLSTIAQG